jgi:hypothetical protein
LFEEALERLQRFRAHVMLDALRIKPGCFGTDTQSAKEGLDDLMSGPAAGGELLAGLGKEYAAIGALQDEPVCSKPLQHFCYCRLGDAETRCDVNLAGFAGISIRSPISST